MSDLISRQVMIDKMRRHRALFCKNRVEFIALPKDEKARVDEIDNCIADLINAQSTEPERTAKVEWSEVDGCHLCGECGFAVCPNCDVYCAGCGAKLDWSGNEAKGETGTVCRGTKVTGQR